MAGRLVVNDIKDCKDLTLNMDNTTITGNFADVTVNHLENVQRAKISTRNLRVISSQDTRDDDSGSAETLSVNCIKQSEDTKINQDRMQISGNFSEIKVDDIEESARTTISMRNAVIKPTNSSIESDDEVSDIEEDAVQQHDDDTKTAEIKLRISIPTASTSATCSFPKSNTVHDVIECISGNLPCPKNRMIVLQDVKSNKILGKDYKMRLDRAGFYNGMELRAIDIAVDERGGLE